MARAVLVICKSGRLDALTTSLYESASAKSIDLYVLSEVSNLSLRNKAKAVFTGRTDDRDLVTRIALEIGADLVVIGPEEPLAAAVVDALSAIGIRCFGPTQSLARIESSKAFARRLVDKIMPSLNPRYGVFNSLEGIRNFMEELGDFVVKPDGLTGGKGVKVLGEHLTNIAEAVDYCREILGREGQSVLLEERLDGEEFSYQSLTDGITTVGTIPIQDHKRAFNNDEGPNTGGMGSYSCADHLLPFLDREAVDHADRANRRVVDALRREFGPYKGVLYGGFIQTKSGLKLIEYNSRFGDPEVMNVLAILKGDFLALCDAIVGQTLANHNVEFARKATVCKYVVPNGYPTDAIKNAEIVIPAWVNDVEGLRVYWGAVNTDASGRSTLYGSRALAFVGVADTLAEAEKIAELGASSIAGPVFHRTDIGTAALVQKRVLHMRELLGQRVFSAA